ncbi:MAG: Gfo/Idh/MocA family oxidoreductase [Gammaproteobacteria bacterium]|nr:Gfo/Idh/MocA family oxidoreductase [Gammaproteobacteria bacterium]
MRNKTALRVGIIGLGVGEQHIEGYRKAPHCTVEALCDFDPQKLQAVGSRWKIRRLITHAEDILSDPNIDVISIASYDNYHADQIVQALQNNKHVFVEKPLCLFEEEACRIRQQLNAKPHLKLSSNLILRKSPRFIDLKQKIQSGVLGKIFYIEGDYNYGRLHKITEGWRGSLPFYSVVYGGGVHIIDLLLWLVEEDIVEVSAFGNKRSTEGSSFRYHDMVVSIIQFKSGGVGKVTANFGCVYPHFHKLSVYGTAATFENTPKGAWLYQSGKEDPSAIDTPYPGVAKSDLIENFTRSIMEPSFLMDVTAEDVFRAMSVCFAIEKAGSASKKIKVQYI